MNQFFKVGTQSLSLFSSYRNQNTRSFDASSNFTYTTTAGTTSMPIRRNHLNPNRKWQYTEYGKELNNRYNKIKLAKFENVKKEITSSNLNDIPTGSNESNRKNFQFKICTYNILAPELVENNKDLYRNLNWRLLDWRNRKIKILNEIKRLSADVSKLS